MTRRSTRKPIEARLDASNGDTPERDAGYWLRRLEYCLSAPWPEVQRYRSIGEDDPASTLQ